MDSQSFTAERHSTYFGELVTRKTLMARLAIKSPTTIYAMVRRGDLPCPITIGAGSKRWVWTEVAALLEAANVAAQEAGAFDPASS